MEPQHPNQSYRRIFEDIGVDPVKNHRAAFSGTQRGNTQREASKIAGAVLPNA
jgi:hypothetical protein